MYRHFPLTIQMFLLTRPYQKYKIDFKNKYIFKIFNYTK